MARIKELRQNSKKELEGRMKDLQLDLMKLRSGSRTGAPEKNTKAIRTARRTLAKIITLLHQKGKEVAKKV